MFRASVFRAAAVALIFGAGLATAQQPPSGPVQADFDVIRGGQSCLVFVEGHEGAGSGFVCASGGQKFFYTNAHVLAGNTPVTLTLLDGTLLRVGAAGSAVGHDMVRFAVAPTQPAFDALERVNDNLLVGDDVLVLGNAKGARVINPIAGKVVGLGPNLVEVDAPFQPGNSGSPIIQKKSGRVVGVATFVTEDRDELGENPRPTARAPAATPPPARKLRRFGYRLDSVKAWQDVAWGEFGTEAAGLKAVDERTNDVLALIRDINEHKGTVRSGQRHSLVLDRVLQAFDEATTGHPSPTDELRARQNLLDGLQKLCQNDLADLRPSLRYDYFQREANDRQRVRDALAKMFGEALKAQANRTGR